MKTIILAAGEGKRMNSKLPKMLHPILGAAMIEHVIRSCCAISEQLFVVTGHGGDEVQAYVRNNLGDINQKLSFVDQPEQKGTGHAVLMAEPYLDTHSESDVLVLYGDVPNVTSETLNKFIETHKKENAAITLISAVTEKPYGYGRIIRENGVFTKIVEEKDVNEQERHVKEINTGVYLFKEKHLCAALKLLNNNNAQHEYYLTDTLEIVKGFGLPTGIYCSEDFAEFSGVNTKVQLAEAAAYMKKRINRKHMEAGVSLMDPDHTYIGPWVTIGADTVIKPGCTILGNTSIGKGCVIGPNSELNHARIHDEVTVWFSVICDSEVGTRSSVGPYAYLRQGSVIGEHCRIGDFVEIKNSVMGNDTKASHLAYVGDSDVGRNVNFGCGAITANYDGKKKHRTTIEDNVFIGCNSNLVAPVTLKEGAYTAAGSTITKEVPSEALAIARCKQENKLGWKRPSCREQ